MWNKSSAPTIGYRSTTADDEDLVRRQQDHLARVRQHSVGPASACLHNQCSECVGTGVKRDGSMCVHMISCPCSRCTPRC